MSKVFTREVSLTVLIWFAIDNVERICLKAFVFEGRTLEESLVLSMVIASDRVRTMRAYCAAVTTGLTRILRRSKRRHGRARAPTRRSLSAPCPLRSGRAVSHRFIGWSTRITLNLIIRRLTPSKNTLPRFTLSTLLICCFKILSVLIVNMITFIKLAWGYAKA